MGRVRHEWATPKKSRFFGLVERGMSKPQAAKELGLAKSTALRWNSDRRTRPLSQYIGRPRAITDEHMKQMVLWVTGHYDRRILPLPIIAKEACGITASYRTLV